ncbi:Rho-associated protein kinase [Gracilaria domingensis]|nr:Rho-associated protein kinase [Gracilaria domingensis]
MPTISAPAWRGAALAAAFASGAALTHLYHRRKSRLLPTDSEATRQLPPSSLLAAIELGGTSCRAAIAFSDDPTKLVDSAEVRTTDPHTTLSFLVRFLRTHAPFVALGVASFGPLDLDSSSPTYGYISSTNKPGWRYTDVLSFFQQFNVPIAFDTDVNAPALAELRYGNHVGDSCAYITVGTGIGVGMVVDGKPIHGLVHPEGGHIMPLRKQLDHYVGCLADQPFSVESMACAKACADRAGVEPGNLPSVSDDHPAWDDVAYYLAQLCYSICMIASPHVIVLSGGVMKRSSLFDKIRAHFVKINNDYLPIDRLTKDIDKYIVQSEYGNNMGIIGAVELARRAALGIK